MQQYLRIRKRKRRERKKIKGIIIAFYKRNGRLPTSDDIYADPNLPCAATIHKYLGGKREWEKLIPPSLRGKSESSSTSKVDDVTNPDALPKEVGEPKADETPQEDRPSKQGTSPNITLDTEPTIVAKHHWEGDTMFVDIKIFKPGRQNPIFITIAV